MLIHRHNSLSQKADSWAWCRIVDFSALKRKGVPSASPQRQILRGGLYFTTTKYTVIIIIIGLRSHLRAIAYCLYRFICIATIHCREMTLLNIPIIKTDTQ